MRTEYDLEMMQEMGFCSGIENYSRHLSGRPPGSRPFTLLDFFPQDFLLVVDESHATIPQIGGMYEGDKSRKTVLVDYGFRLPSALDNRPLSFPEFMEMTKQIALRERDAGGVRDQEHRGREQRATFRTSGSGSGRRRRCRLSWRERGKGTSHVARSGGTASNVQAFVSRTDQPVEEFDVHTPGAPLVVEQIIRPTGLLDPKITIKPLKNQIDDTLELCRQRIEKKERVLITTLTKRTAEDLSDYLRDVGLKVRYLHSDIDTIERVEILRGLRAAEFDVLVGINLLREGLDLPEVSLVCILDADKEGYLRSQTSLIQTAGRAARHVNGEVVLFADIVTQSMEALLSITEYRRAKQIAYNEKHGITPHDVQRAVQESLHTILRGREVAASVMQEARRRFQSHRTAARTGAGDAERRGEPGIRKRRAAARSDRGTEERHRHDEDRAEAEAGEVFARRCAGPALTRVTGRDAALRRPTD